MPVLLGDNPISEEYNIVVTHGETFDRTFKWTDSAGVGISLAGGSASMKARKVIPPTTSNPTWTRSGNIFALTSGSGITLNSGSVNGAVRTIISKATIETIKPDIYYYVLSVTLSGTTTILSKGLFEVRVGMEDTAWTVP